MKASTSNYSVILEDQFPTFGSTEVRQKVITLPRFSSSIVCVRISHQQNVINARAFQLLEEISYFNTPVTI